MMVTNVSPATVSDPSWLRPAAAKPPSPNDGEDKKVHDAFKSFVGQTLFGQLLKAMRKTLGKPAYFYGGRAEEVFQQQLDQVLAEKVAETSADRLSEPMFELFMMKRA